MNCGSSAKLHASLLIELLIVFGYTVDTVIFVGEAVYTLLVFSSIELIERGYYYYYY